MWRKVRSPIQIAVFLKEISNRLSHPQHALRGQFNSLLVKQSCENSLDFQTRVTLAFLDLEEIGWSLFFVLKLLKNYTLSLRFRFSRRSFGVFHFIPSFRPELYQNAHLTTICRCVAWRNATIAVATQLCAIFALAVCRQAWNGELTAG